MSKDRDYNRLIHSDRWLKLRKAKLTACPLCERCKEEGRTTAATEVHHVKPVEDAMSFFEKESLMYDPHNLRALCHDCHVKTHNEMGRGGGKAQARRKASEMLKSFGKKFLSFTPGAFFLRGGASRLTPSALFSTRGPVFRFLEFMQQAQNN